jgi:hypothetical protein
MRVLFHTNTLNYRGTTTAVVDYARYNQEILGNESIISYDNTFEYIPDLGTETEVLNNLKKKFTIVPATASNIDVVVSREKVDVGYFLRSGERDFLPQNCKTAVHAVFQHCAPHGDSYAYVSEWLSLKMTGGMLPFVPHIVDLPKPNSCLRKRLNISDDQIVIGRIGGRYTFDLSLAQEVVVSLATKYNNKIVFLFVGTEPWIVPHHNIIFLPPISNLQEKSDFINTCDGMLHGRVRGESFGLAIAEGLIHNKPVFAWAGGQDKNHISMLKNSDLLYENAFELESKILNVKTMQQDYTKLVEDFLPQPTMRKFNQVFLGN